MAVLKRILYGDGQDFSKRIYLSNFCSSMLYSVQSAILLLIVTRVGGLHAAGEFSIIYTVTQTLATLGSYSMRNFQVSDAKNQFSFAEYYVSRIITCTLMMMACMVYCIFKGADIFLYVMILSWGVYRYVDGLEDVYHGQIQKNGRLDVASIANVIRIALSVLVFTLFYFVSKNLVIASGALALASLLLFCILNKAAFNEWELRKEKCSMKKILQLLIESFPIFFGAILYSYLINAPKYAIDRNLDKETQAIFNVIFMPIFVINVLSQMIFKPMIVHMSIWWKENQVKKVCICVLKQCLIIMGLTIGVAVCGYLFGGQILGLVYAVDLTPYKMLFTMLLLLGGIAALGVFLSIILTIMRKQFFIIVGYVFAFLFSCICIDDIVKSKGIVGAGISYGIIMGIVTLFFCICIVINIIIEYMNMKRRKRKDFPFEKNIS